MMIIRSLPNGVMVVVAPIEVPTSFAIAVLTRGGSDYETLETNGISHVQEHMHFQGSRKYPTALSIARAIEGSGGGTNAFTEREVVGYHTSIHNRSWQLAVDISGDMLTQPLFHEEDFQNSKQVVVEEITEGADYPDEILYEEYDKALYPNHPAGFPIGGYPETVTNLTHVQLLENFRRFYVGRGVVIAASGHIDNEEQVFQSIADRFSGMRAGEIIRKRPLNIVQSKPVLLAISKNFKKSHIVVGVKAVSRKDPRSEALALLSTILGGNMSSRLFNILRERLGMTYTPKTTLELLSDRGFLETHAVVHPGKMLDAISLILEEYRRIAGEGVTEEELHEAKEYSLGNLDMHLENPHAIAIAYATHALLGLEIDLEKMRRDREAVTMDDIANIAREIFRPERLNVGVIGRHRSWARLERLIYSW